MKEKEEVGAEAERLAKMDKDENEKLEKEIADLRKKDNARTLKDEAINIASQKDIPISYLELINFESVNAGQVKTAIENVETLVILPYYILI